MTRPFDTLVGTIARRLLPAALLLLGAGTGAAAAGKVTIKLGTLAPRGTSYHKTLMTMGEKWRTASGGAVKLVVFPDGTQGGEADMVGLMQTGSLDAGMLTGVGLSEIEKGVSALGGTPMNYRNLDELEYVIEKLRPTLEKRMLEKGFVVLFWGDSGFVRFFSKTPLVHPDDLRRAKFFCWAGNAEEFDLWKSAGYHPVALETVNIMPSLQTGLIDTVAMPPFFALASQLDAQAPNMLLLNWGPLVGGTVVTRRTWEKIPAELRPALLKAAAEAGREIKAAGRAENERSVEALKKRGVKVTVPTPEIEAAWRKAVDPYRDKIRGRLVPADLFDEVARFLKEYRTQTGAAGQ